MIRARRRTLNRHILPMIPHFPSVLCLHALRKLPSFCRIEQAVYSSACSLMGRASNAKPAYQFQLQRL